VHIKVGIVVFPGSNCDRDVYHVFKNILKVDTELIWHKRDDLRGFDAVILPGGFAYADRLRAGVIAAHSPVMQEVKRLAKDGLPILGICNGFQILVESELLPGAFMRNDTLRFICRWVSLRVNVDSKRSPFTTLLSNDQILNIPIANQEGRYYVDDDTLNLMHKNRQIVLTYTNNPNGSLHSIACICNEQGNVMGIIPHPERASDPMLNPLNHGNDGLLIFKSLLAYLGCDNHA
jgi:phosphoribosylformylglycinamidine synthase